MLLNIAYALNDGTTQVLLGIVFLVSGLAISLLSSDSGPGKTRGRA